MAKFYIDSTALKKSPRQIGEINKELVSIEKVLRDISLTNWPEAEMQSLADSVGEIAKDVKEEAKSAQDLSEVLAKIITTYENSEASLVAKKDTVDQNKVPGDSKEKGASNPLEALKNSMSPEAWDVLMFIAGLIPGLNILVDGYTLVDDINKFLKDGKISAGEAPNIIPDSAEMLGSIRTMSTEKMEWAQKRIKEIAEAIGTAYRTEVTVEYKHFLPAMIAEPEVTKCAVTYMRELLGPCAMQIPAGQNGGGSEDFAHVASKVPSVPMFLAAGNLKDGYMFPAHNPKVRFDEAALPNGAAAHAYLAIRWLQDHK